MRSRRPRSAGSSSSAAQLRPQARVGGAAQLARSSSRRRPPGPSAARSRRSRRPPPPGTRPDSASRPSQFPPKWSPDPPAGACASTTSGVPLDASSPTDSSPTQGFVDAQHLLGEDRCPSCRTGSRLLGPRLGVGAGVDQHAGAAAGRQRHGDPGPVHAADAAHRQQRGGQHGAGRSGRDRRLAARPSRTIRQAVTIDEPGLARTAAAGSSWKSIRSGASTISTPARRPESPSCASRARAARPQSSTPMPSPQAASSAARHDARPAPRSAAHRIERDGHRRHRQRSTTRAGAASVSGSTSRPRYWPQLPQT